MAQKDCFSYSDKNEYTLEIPVELAEKIERKSRKGSVPRNSSGKKPFNFMLIIRVLALAVFIVAAVMLAKRIYEYTKDIRYSEAQNRSIAVQSYTGPEVEKRETPVYPEFEGKTVETGRFDYPQITDSEKLAQFSLAYPDFVLWMFIDNSYVNYPVVQAENNEYYLRRNMDGEDNIAGTLFMDYRSDSADLRGHTIVYGHNVQNGTMFGLLKLYLNKSYYDEHSVIYTYNKDSVTVWKIFSAYETDTENYYIDTYFPTEDEYDSFLQKLKSDSAYDTGVEVDSGDDILTLSTCFLYSKANGRFVVHAVKTGVTPLN